MALVLMLAIPAVSVAAGDSYVDSLWTTATQAYADGRWDDALETYSSIDRLGLESPFLYCNIGSAYFKVSDYPHAILYYERALKLDPSCSDARYNLQVVSGLVQDKIDPVPEFLLKEWAREHPQEREEGMEAAPEEMTEYVCAHGEESVPPVFLEKSGLAASRGEARRLIKQGALTVNNERWDDAVTPLAQGEYVVKLGKKRFAKIIVR